MFFDAHDNLMKLSLKTIFFHFRLKTARTIRHAQKRIYTKMLKTLHVKDDTRLPQTLKGDRTKVGPMFPK